MKEGLLWYDDNPKRDLAEKVTRAVAHYTRKHDAAPNICYIHPLALSDNGKVKIPGLCVVSKSTVLRHHFWVGIETERSKAE